MYKKILIAYDASNASKKALDTAINTAAKNHAELLVITVCHPPEIGHDFAESAQGGVAKIRFHPEFDRADFRQMATGSRIVGAPSFDNG